MMAETQETMPWSIQQNRLRFASVSVIVQVTKRFTSIGLFRNVFQVLFLVNSRGGPQGLASNQMQPTNTRQYSVVTNLLIITSRMQTSPWAEGRKDVNVEEQDLPLPSQCERGK